MDCKGARSSPVLEEERHAAREEKSSQCISGKAPAMCHASSCPREPFVDLKHPRDRSQAASSAQSTSKAKVEEGKGRTACSQKETLGGKLE